MAAGASAWAMRVIHDEQAFMWECRWCASRLSADQAGPLAWTPSPYGPRLTGGQLPAPSGPGLPAPSGPGRIS